MIRSETVFVLGAGAHISYGFPSGEQLKSEIIRELRGGLRSGGETHLRYIMGRGWAPHDAFSARNVEAFIEALHLAGHASIDAFLNANTHIPGYEFIGKAGIAQALLRCELSSDVHRQPNDDDWLNYIFREMLDGARSPEQFAANNHVTFITFNYDRTLESWLHTKIQASYGMDERASFEVLENIPIIHVYGSLGGYPYLKGTEIGQKWVDSLQRLKLIHELEHDHEIIRSAREALQEAQTIYLLGFGFHRENIEILGLEPIFSAGGRAIIASRYGFTDAEWRRLTGRYPEGLIIQAGSEYKCLGTLRNTAVF